MERRIPDGGRWPERRLDRIACADAREALGELPGECVALVATSPPYGNVADYGIEGQIGQTDYEAHLDDLMRVWREAAWVLIPNGNSPSSPPSCRSPRAGSATSTPATEAPDDDGVADPRAGSATSTPAT